jgi:hypothetical protein
MAPPNDIALMREDEVPSRAGDLIAREAAWPRAIATLGCLAVGLALVGASVAGAWRGAVAVPVMFGFGGLCMVLIGLAFRGTWKAARRPTNWRLRATEDGLFIKLRSFLNHELPPEDRIVAFVPKRRVAWLRQHRQKLTTADHDGDNRMTVKRGSLEVSLDASIEAIETAIAEERQRWITTRMGRKRHGHYPVSVQPGRVLRLDWHGPDSVMRPKLEATLETLIARHGYRSAPAALTERDVTGTRAGVDHEAQLLEHAQRGETMQAIALARRIYGYDLTEAKRFVESLKADQAASGRNSA